MFFVVSAVVWIAVSTPLLVFGDQPEIPDSTWDRRGWAAAWVVVLSCALAAAGASMFARENLRPFPGWKGLAAAFGAGLVVIAFLNLKTNRCSTRSGGRWIKGRNYNYEGDRTKIVAALRALFGAGLLALGYYPWPT